MNVGTAGDRLMWLMAFWEADFVCLFPNSFIRHIDGKQLARKHPSAYRWRPTKKKELNAYFGFPRMPLEKLTGESLSNKNNVGQGTEKNHSVATTKNN